MSTWLLFLTYQENPLCETELTLSFNQGNSSFTNVYKWPITTRHFLKYIK